jgi:type IV pilus assembly protein PilE
LASQKISSCGFTLLEVVIALAVIGTLLTIAIPSYQQYVQRVRRADAIRIILAAADCQGRIRAETGFFDTTRCVPEHGDTHYQFSYQPSGQAITERYTIIATPLGGDDHCNALRLDHTGSRSISNSGGSVLKCWGGR